MLQDWINWNSEEGKANSTIRTSFANFRECEPNTLVDILHYAEQPNAEEYRKELEQINGSTSSSRDIKSVVDFV